ncbi:GGDEF domain-containing protein [Elusimicrobiota bacterium]
MDAMLETIPELTLFSATHKRELLARLCFDLRRSNLQIDEILKKALHFLKTELDVRSASVFLFSESKKMLVERVHISHDGTCIAGSRQQIVLKRSILNNLISGKKSSIDLNDGRILFALKSDPDSCISGVLEVLPSVLANREMIKAWCEEVGGWLKLVSMSDKVDFQAREVETFRELSWLFVSSLRLEDRLRLILKGIQKLFKLDRVQLYLLDSDETELKGEIEVSFNHGARQIKHKKFPIPPGYSKGLADIIRDNLRLDPWSRIVEYSIRNQENLLHVPLKIQSKEIGVLAIDNILSQEPISEFTKHVIESLVGQISLAVDNARLFEEVEKLSLYDTLSRLPNRRYFEQKLEGEIYRSSRTNTPFALCIMDLDFFKEINDTYGHQMGDKAISSVGKAIQGAIRQSDFAARWGGDEITILLANASHEEVLVVCERIMQAIRSIKLIFPADPPKEISLTASMGVAVYAKNGLTAQAMIESADKALYDVKCHGRNSFKFA